MDKNFKDCDDSGLSSFFLYFTNFKLKNIITTK